ncbi:HAMP domain-containing sensor histidine kinase [Luteimonas sp. YGD11-2]|uniref:sensor histidine kinase n=1 Tax=Luteimonas sp. YGD11-2 TaxID=2508168 RepID=UPI00100A775C|nr:HAMP domain-containing sensor histidine kinase [Luteimonas sp. YGD11-2]
MPQGIPRKVRVAFMIQAALGSLVIVLGVTIAFSTVLRVLVDARLRAQADEYWSLIERDPANPVLPETDLVHGYFLRRGAADRLPPTLRRLSAGHHYLASEGRDVLVEGRDVGVLVLSMDLTYARRTLWMMGALLMLGGIAAIHLFSWFTYRTTRRLVAPVSWLAEEVSRWDPDAADPGSLIPERIPGEVGREVDQLSNALTTLSARVQAFVQRERDFTRDASHELRTPLTVIRVASDMLLADDAIPQRSHRSLQRIHRATRDMEAVIDAFLILAREDDIAVQGEDFDVHDVVMEEVEKVQPLLQGKPVELRVTGHTRPRLDAPPRVLGVMLGNLLSNACIFTEEGSIEVEVLDDRVLVRDTGIGMSPEVLQRVYDPFYRADPFRSGKGMGLSIVRRLGERFGWPVSLESQPGEGTTATIRYG